MATCREHHFVKEQRTSLSRESILEREINSLRRQQPGKLPGYATWTEEALVDPQKFSFYRERLANNYSTPMFTPAFNSDAINNTVIYVLSGILEFLRSNGFIEAAAA